MNYFVTIFLLLGLAPLAAGTQTKAVNWKEEVKLSDGQIAIVERSENYRPVFEPGARGSGWLFMNERLRATLPPSNRKIVWEARLEPIALDVAASGEIYLVAVVAEAAGRKEYAVPDGTNHVAFKYIENNQWQRVPITSIPRELHPNLMVATRRLFIEQRSTTDFVDLALKAKMDADPRIDSRFRKWPTQQ